MVDKGAEPDYPANKQEKDRELDRMSANIRWLRVWGHLRMRAPTISREQAREIATDVAKDRDVRDVVDLAERTLIGLRTPCVYNLELSGCWIAYLATRNPYALRASDIVVIDKGDRRGSVHRVSERRGVIS